MQHSAMNNNAMAYRRVGCCAMQESSPEEHFKASTPWEHTPSEPSPLECYTTRAAHGLGELKIIVILLI